MGCKSNTIPAAWVTDIQVGLIWLSNAPFPKNSFSNPKSRQVTGKFVILSSKTMSMCLTGKKSFLSKQCSLLSLKDLNAHVLHPLKNGTHFSTYFIRWLSTYFKKDKWKNIFHDVFKSSSYGFAEIDSSAEERKILHLKLNRITWNIWNCQEAFWKDALMHVTASPSVVLIFLSNNSLEFHLVWMLE